MWSAAGPGREVDCSTVAWGKLNCSPVRQSTANANTVGHRVRLGVRRGTEKKKSG